MIMTQNQILLAEARFGFRYASDRVPKQGTQSGASYFALNCRAPAKVVLGCRKASPWAVILRRLRIRSVWHLLQIDFVAS